MSQFFIPGPALLYAGIGGTRENRIPVYLGTSIDTVRVEVREATRPVFNSLGGSSIPMDEAHDGEVAFIAFAINRFNHDRMEQLMAAPSPFLSDVSPAPGTYAREAIGTLYGTEGFTFPFWAVAPYQSFDAYANMSAGKRFWACKVESPKGFDLGAKDKTYSFVIKATRAWTTASTPLTGPSVVSTGYPARWRLYDEDMTGLPTPD